MFTPLSVFIKIYAGSKSSIILKKIIYLASGSPATDVSTYTMPASTAVDTASVQFTPPNAVATPMPPGHQALMPVLPVSLPYFPCLLPGVRGLLLMPASAW